MPAAFARFSVIVISLMSGAALADGELAAIACQACHGSNGMNASPDIPDLAGQKKLYLTTQLHAFKSGTRKHDLMGPIAAQLDDATIASLATYWSSIPVSASGASTARLDASQSPLTFPANFPHGFVLYHTSADEDGSTSRYYANEAAVSAARAGKPLPDGAAIVVVAYSRGSTAPTYSVMEARAGWGDAAPTLLRNGNWRYALFDTRLQRLDNFNYARCLACHKPAADKSFVFTLDTLAKSSATAEP